MDILYVTPAYHVAFWASIPHLGGPEWTTSLIWKAQKWASLILEAQKAQQPQTRRRPSLVESLYLFRPLPSELTTPKDGQTNDWTKKAEKGHKHDSKSSQTKSLKNYHQTPHQFERWISEVKKKSPASRFHSLFFSSSLGRRSAFSVDQLSSLSLPPICEKCRLSTAAKNRIKLHGSWKSLLYSINFFIAWNFSLEV